MNRAMSVNRAQSLASDQDVNDSLAEIELQKLQRQYRIMEGDRKAYSEESRILISKQRMTIYKLKNDNSHLVEELKLLESRNNARKLNGQQNKKAEELSEQAENYNWKIKQLTPEILDLNKTIAHLGKEIDAKRAELGGVNAATENCGAISKQIKVLENRLDKALVKYNKSLAVNKQLRSSIDNLRRERLVFDNIYRKFEKELMEQKKTMAEIIEMSNSAYEARDEAQAKIIAWREKIEKEHQAYIQEIKELDRAFEQDRKLKEFMATKATDRLEKIIEAGGEIKQKSDNKKNKDGISPKFSSQESLVESLEFYEKAFAEIKRVTSTDDVEGLVQRFKAVEDTNFSLFNYVNEINNEIEKLSEEISDAQGQIDALKIEGVAVDEERQKEMSGFESNLNSNLARNGLYDKQFNDTLYATSEIRKGVDKLVKIFQSTRFSFSDGQAYIITAPTTAASSTAQNDDQQSSSSAATPQIEEEQANESNFTNIPRFALGSTAITDTNLLQILGVIEHKMNELMTLNYMFNTPRKIGSAGANVAAAVAPSSADASDQSRSGETASGENGSPAQKEHGVLIMPLLGTVGGLLGQGPIAPVGNISIVPPSTGDDHDSEDNLSEEDDRPLSREELKQKTLRGISKRERLIGQTAGTAKKGGMKKTERGKK